MARRDQVAEQPAALPPSRLRLWAPLVAMTVLSALMLLVAPSRPDGVASGADTAAVSAGGADGQDAALLNATGPGSASPAAGEQPGGRAAARGSTPTGASTAQASEAGGGAAPAARVGGDVSHCTRDGRQHAVSSYAPPCVPAFTGDNGGSTAKGITGDRVRVVLFNAKYDEALFELYRAAGYDIPTKAQYVDHQLRMVDHLNRRYELYGRRIAAEVFFSDCTVPPDDAACRASARQVIATKPFAVVFSYGLSFSSVYDEFARAGVLTLGGSGFGREAFASPLRWEFHMDGTTASEHVGEYWCRKLQGRPASNAGVQIHRSIGGRDTPRRPGVVVAEDAATRPTADTLASLLRRCGADPTVVAYELDYATAQQQASALTLRFIRDRVTSVIWLDASAPRALAAEFTRQGYFPEHLVTPYKAHGRDVITRGSDQQQWQHAFGPVGIEPETAADRYDGARAYRDGGGKGPVDGDLMLTHYPNIALLGALLQGAGPRLTPASVALGAERLPAIGGGTTPLLRLGRGDHTWMDDAREAYWSPDGVSPVDGERGTWVTLNRGRRFALGQWSAPFGVPAAER